MVATQTPQLSALKAFAAWNRCIRVAEDLPQKTTRDVAVRIVSMPMASCGKDLVRFLALLPENTTSITNTLDATSAYCYVIMGAFKLEATKRNRSAELQNCGKT